MSAQGEEVRRSTLSEGCVDGKEKLLSESVSGASFQGSSFKGRGSEELGTEEQ